MIKKMFQSFTIYRSRYITRHKRFPVYSIARVRLDRDNLIGVNDTMHPSSPHIVYSPKFFARGNKLTIYFEMFNMTGSQFFLLTGLE